MEKKIWLKNLGIILLIILLLSFDIFLIRPVLISMKELPLFPKSVPNDINLYDEENYEVKADTNLKSFLFPYGHPAKIKILFEKNISIYSHWKGSEPMFIITSPFVDTINAITMNDSWGDFKFRRGNSPMEDFIPWIETNFQLDKQYYHHWVTTIAKLNIVYPTIYNSSYGTGTYSDEYSQVERSIKLFVVSPNEYQIIKNYKEIDSYRAIKSIAWFYLIFIFFLNSFAIWGIASLCKMIYPSIFRNKKIFNAT